MLGDSLGSYDGTTLDYYCCVSDEAKDGILYCSALVVPLGYTDGLLLDSYKIINLGCTDAELLGFTLGVEHEYTHGLYK